MTWRRIEVVGGAGGRGGKDRTREEVKGRARDHQTEGDSPGNCQ